MLYFKFFKIHVKKVMQYRFSLLLTLFAQSLTAIMAILTIYFLFDRFNIVKGWTFEQVSISYAVVYLSFALVECFFRGVDQFSKLVKSGSLDGFFVRPRGILTQAVCNEIEFSKLGRIIVGLVVLIYSCIIQPFTWTPLKIFVLLAMILCGVIIFFSLFLIGASFSIFTIEGIETMNIFTDGGREFCQYPVDIYGNFMKKLFTFIIPFACFNYLPMKYIFDIEGATIWGHAMAPLYGCLFFIPAYIFFRFALKKYASSYSLDLLLKNMHLQVLKKQKSVIFELHFFFVVCVIYYF